MTTDLRVVLGILFLAGLLPAARGAEAELWTDDYQGAMEKAEKEGKDLLIDFTGSDWCEWCIRLRQEVFSQADFIQQAPQQFVLVELDFPQRKEVPAKIKEQNKVLQEAFGIEGFPTIFLADAQGRAYARTGYRAGGAAPYLQHLTALRKNKASRDEALAKAQKAEGLEKARLLDQALTPLAAAGALVGYQEEIREIIKLDAGNKEGLKGKYEGDAQLKDIEKTLKGPDPAAAKPKVEALLKVKGLTDEQRQRASIFRGICVYNDDDKKGALAIMEAALKIAPKSRVAPTIQQVIAALKEEIEQK